MRDFMNLSVEESGNDVIITLSGMFGVRELTILKNKLDMLLRGPGIFFFLNLQKAVFLDEEYLKLFLQILSTLKKRNARLILLFSNVENEKFFAPYASVFEIASSRENFQKSGFVRQLRQVGVYYSKQTGIRIAPSAAIALGTLLFGWFVTLLFIISSQNAELAERRERIAILEKETERSLREIERLESMVVPLRNLNLAETEETTAFGAIRDWIYYLDRLDSLRREN